MRDGMAGRRMSGVICDRRVPARVKGKVYRVAVRPAMLYGLETVELTKRQEADMEVAELRRRYTIRPCTWVNRNV